MKPQARLIRTARLARHDAFALLGKWEWTSMPFLRVQREFSAWPHPVTTRATDIVIDGYPRSANTFAVQVFVYANGHGLRIAHHVHAPVQFKRAARMGRPAVLLVRHPEEAVLSRVVRDSDFGLRRAIRDYVWMYEPMVPLLDEIVVAPFDQVTTDMNPIIRDVNARWGTAFQDVEDWAAARKWIHDKISWWNEYHEGGETTSLPLPTEARTRPKAAAAEELEQHKQSVAWSRAVEVYETLIARE